MYFLGFELLQPSGRVSKQAHSSASRTARAAEARKQLKLKLQLKLQLKLIISEAGSIKTDVQNATSLMVLGC